MSSIKPIVKSVDLIRCDVYTSTNMSYYDGQYECLNISDSESDYDFSNSIVLDNSYASFDYLFNSSEPDFNTLDGAGSSSQNNNNIEENKHVNSEGNQSNEATDFDAMERHARRLLAAGQVENFEEAELVVTLMSLKFSEEDSLDAAKNCSDLDKAVAFLQQECQLCTEKFSINKMVSMLRCTHNCCKTCAKKFFTIQIKEQSIMECFCPFCKEPDLNKITEEERFDYFNNLEVLLRGILEHPIHELFQQKLRDQALSKNPNFQWCIECSFGFIIHPDETIFVCPKCKVIMCSKCRKPWESQHENLSCKQFAEWKTANDPNTQATALTKYLADNGIDCPKCKFRFNLAKGGCMHFTCTQCKHEFCYGCNKPFVTGSKCMRFCSNQGLHAHHPRNCLFYLRSKTPIELQRVLKENNIKFNTSAPEEGVDNARAVLKCNVELQFKELSSTYDSYCNASVRPNEAGLCRPHYIEYLVDLIKKNNLDPVNIMTINEICQELSRKGLGVVEKSIFMSDAQYRQICVETMLKRIPLD